MIYTFVHLMQKSLSYYIKNINVTTRPTLMRNCSASTVCV